VHTKQVTEQHYIWYSTPAHKNDHVEARSEWKRWN